MTTSAFDAACVVCVQRTTAHGMRRNSAGTGKRRQAAARTAQIVALEARADRVKDSNDIKRLQRAYGFYLDKAKWDDMADLFAADASVEYAQRRRVRRPGPHPRIPASKLGHDRIGLVEGEINNHMILQPVVHVAPDGMTAKARWRALIQTGQYKKTRVVGRGHLRESRTSRKTASGRSRSCTGT